MFKSTYNDSFLINEFLYFTMEIQNIFQILREICL